MIKQYFNQRGWPSGFLTSLAFVVFVSTVPLLRSLPWFSVLLGTLGAYLIALSIEDETRRMLMAREKSRQFEINKLLVDWPGAKVSHVVPQTPPLWKLLRPSLLGDLLWRNAYPIPYSK